MFVQLFEWTPEYSNRLILCFQLNCTIFFQGLSSVFLLSFSYCLLSMVPVQGRPGPQTAERLFQPVRVEQVSQDHRDSVLAEFVPNCHTIFRRSLPECQVITLSTTTTCETSLLDLLSLCRPRPRHTGRSGERSPWRCPPPCSLCLSQGIGRKRGKRRRRKGSSSKSN